MIRSQVVKRAFAGHAWSINGLRGIAGLCAALLVVSCAATTVTAAPGGDAELTLEAAYQQALASSTLVAAAKLSLRRAELFADQTEETARDIELSYVGNWDLVLLKRYYPESAASSLESARLALDSTEKYLRLSVSEAYYNVLKAEATLRAQQAGMRRAEEQLATASAMFDAGMVPRTDVLAAEVGVSSARAAEAAASRALRMAVMALNQVLHRDLDTEVRLSANPELREPETLDLSRVVDEAVARRLDVKQASASLTASEACL
ncbi:MAG: TolC family protein, partial [Firmicutes bacterium]|nr:TolC family protein [Bacillota bacterium]